ncbi:MAG: ectoine hydroxylase-related dioxygenase (phytanoyl-CoA dioxygenase family) [Candidatus Azotimanducaceae bacterium]
MTLEKPETESELELFCFGQRSAKVEFLTDIPIRYFYPIGKLRSAVMDLAEHLSEIDTKGYTILENVLSNDEVADVKQALSPWLKQELMGRNNFEGLKTERVYALLAKIPAMSKILEHPRLLALLDQMLAEHYLLSANLAINLHPGETPQPFHADHTQDGNCDRTKLSGVSTIWAFDDFTESNGATEVVEGSHRWTTEEFEAGISTAKPTTKVLMEAGSVLVFHGSLYHRGGANDSVSTRLAITPQYCQPWLRQLENMVLAIPPAVAGQFSDRLQEMLGFGVREPSFMGYVDGLHPRKLIDASYQGRKARGVPS